MLEKARKILKETYGYPFFKGGQEMIIQSILQGADTLGIMPTGGGKSVCYQIPALLFPGTALVVSPLISLMKDQVDALNSLGLAATFINSSLSNAEVEERMKNAGRGKYKLVYVAPERLDSNRFLAGINALPVSLLAVDEAHCVSQWGHDFRPSYLSVAALINELPCRPVVAAFTATATEEVRQDIVNLLSLERPKVYVTGFNRENLTFSVIRGEDKRDYIINFLREHREHAGIIYAATRKEVDNLHKFLCKKRIAAGKYHAGLSDEERTSSQEQFLYDDIRVMVATNAFGMGIDKSNVRYVIHHNMPKNVEAYYQEAGRAGRDDGPGDCILLFNPQDIRIQKFLIEQSTLSPERKTNEYKKLQAMVDYCHTQRCLRKYILQYFGEGSTGDECGNCGNCYDHVEFKDITVDAQKIFSCILRVKEQFGVTTVAEILKGSQSKKMAQYGFQRLSTYGLLKKMTVKQITGLINMLVAEGYIYITEGEYPLARLRPVAFSVLKGEKAVLQKVQKKEQAVAADNTLFEQLRDLRKEISQKEGVPPYIIFHDSTLREMCERCPTDRMSMLTVKGVGQAKFNRYGELFLELIRKHFAE